MAFVRGEQCGYGRPVRRASFALARTLRRLVSLRPSRGVVRRPGHPRKRGARLSRLASPLSSRRSDVREVHVEGLSRWVVRHRMVVSLLWLAITVGGVLVAPTVSAHLKSGVH